MGIKYSNEKANSFNKATKYTTNPSTKDKNFFCNLGDNFMLKNEYRKAVKEYLVSLILAIVTILGSFPGLSISSLSSYILTLM